MKTSLSTAPSALATELGALGVSGPILLHAARRQSLPSSAHNDIEKYFSRLRLKEIAVEYDGKLKVLWCRFLYRERPSFTLALLNEIGVIQNAVKQLFSTADAVDLDYVVWRSAVPGVFGLGGDLGLFSDLIAKGDRAALLHYAEICIDRVFQNWISMDAPVVTVSLIQGNCLGGAFECALSSNLMVAERSAKIGLPEVLFNLFPGMGAYSFLSRRVAPHLARKIISSGRIYLGQELHDMGLVDVVAEDGCGETAFIDYLRANRSTHGLRQYLDKVERIVHRLEKDELMEVTRLWVDRALELTEADLKIMTRLVTAQLRQHNRPPA